MTPIFKGKRVTFNYGQYGTPDAHPDYSAHRGQCVKIIRQLSERECDTECGPMFRIEAADGWQGDAFADELS